MIWEAIWSPPWSPKSLFWHTCHLVTVDGWNPAPDKLSMLTSHVPWNPVWDHNILTTWRTSFLRLHLNQKRPTFGLLELWLTVCWLAFLGSPTKKWWVPRKVSWSSIFAVKIRWIWQWFIDTQKEVPHFTVIFSKPFIDRCYIYPYQLSIVEGFIVSSIIARESVQLAWFCQQKWVICVMKEWMVQSGMPSKSRGLSILSLQVELQMTLVLKGFVIQKWTHQNRHQWGSRCNYIIYIDIIHLHRV